MQTNEFFVFVTISRNTAPLFHKKAITQDPLQKIYPNMARMCKNKFLENKVKLKWLNTSKKIYYGITDRGRGQKAPLPPASDRVKRQCLISLCALRL